MKSAPGTVKNRGGIARICRAGVAHRPPPARIATPVAQQKTAQEILRAVFGEGENRSHGSRAHLPE